jgi:diketogulonate reductase-like aldo/keto reductase
MVTLNNGVDIPHVGLGVFQTKEGAEVERAVRTALETGYRLIDTAAAYGNEVGVGKAIKASGLAREEVVALPVAQKPDNMSVAQPGNRDA